MDHIIEKRADLVVKPQNSPGTQAEKNSIAEIEAFALLKAINRVTEKEVKIMVDNQNLK